MRTQKEILDRIEDIRDRQDDLFGFEVSDLIDYLNYEHAKPFLRYDAAKNDWIPAEQSDVQSKMIDYMEFAQEKADNERGLSAGRSINHYSAWLWIDGNEELSESIREYTDYGKPQLRQIYEYLYVDSADIQ